MKLKISGVVIIVAVTFQKRPRIFVDRSLLRRAQGPDATCPHYDTTCPPGGGDFLPLQF